MSDDDPTRPITYVRGDITELGRRIGKGFAEERRADQAKPTVVADPDPIDKIACVLRTGVTHACILYTLETMGTLPYNIEQLRVTKPTRSGAEWALRWLYAQELMNPRRRIYTGDNASKKARERAKRAELIIVPEVQIE